MKYNMQEVTMAHDVDGWWVRVMSHCRSVAALFRLELPLFEEFGTLAQWSIGLIHTQRQSFWWRSADVLRYNVLHDFMFIDVFLYESTRSVDYNERRLTAALLPCRSKCKQGSPPE
jgi:hypothetical protein